MNQNSVTRLCMYSQIIYGTYNTLLRCSNLWYNYNVVVTDEWWRYAEWVCKVYTEDDQNYTIKLLDENVLWSDWKALTIDDIFFTYDEIIRKNRWWIDSLNAWSSISVALEDGKIKESGTHDELVKLGGSYARMAGIQS